MADIETRAIEDASLLECQDLGGAQCRAVDAEGSCGGIFHDELRQIHWIKSSRVDGKQYRHDSPATNAKVSRIDRWSARMARQGRGALESAGQMPRPGADISWAPPRYRQRRPPVPRSARPPRRPPPQL